MRFDILVDMCRLLMNGEEIIIDRKDLSEILDQLYCESGESIEIRLKSKNEQYLIRVLS